MYNFNVNILFKMCSVLAVLQHSACNACLCMVNLDSPMFFCASLLKNAKIDVPAEFQHDLVKAVGIMAGGPSCNFCS